MAQIDRDMLNKIGSLNDEDFKALLEKVTASCGIGNAYTDIILKNSAKVKRKLERMDEKDIKALSDKLGDDKLNEIISQIKRGE